MLAFAPSVPAKFPSIYHSSDRVWRLRRSARRQLMQQRSRGERGKDEGGKSVMASQVATALRRSSSASDVSTCRRRCVGRRRARTSASRRVARESRAFGERSSPGSLAPVPGNFFLGRSVRDLDARGWPQLGQEFRRAALFGRRRKSCRLPCCERVAPPLPRAVTFCYGSRVCSCEKAEYRASPRARARPR
jgi:hypothetical protein